LRFFLCVEYSSCNANRSGKYYWRPSACSMLGWFTRYSRICGTASGLSRCTMKSASQCSSHFLSRWFFSATGREKSQRIPYSYCLRCLAKPGTLGGNGCANHRSIPEWNTSGLQGCLHCSWDWSNPAPIRATQNKASRDNLKVHECWDIASGPRRRG